MLELNTKHPRNFLYTLYKVVHHNINSQWQHTLQKASYKIYYLHFFNTFYIEFTITSSFVETNNTLPLISQYQNAWYVTSITCKSIEHCITILLKTVHHCNNECSYLYNLNMMASPQASINRYHNVSHMKTSRQNHVLVICYSENT